MSILETALNRFATSALGYYRLWEYFDLTARRIISRRKTHKVKTCLEFYKGVFSGEIKHGDRIILDGFFVTEWIPRDAGAAASLVNEHLTVREYFRSHSHRIWQRAPLPSHNMVPMNGSVRMPIERGKRIILGAVSESEYMIDYGLVLSVTDPVYSSFLSKQMKNSAVAASLEGYVEMYHCNEAFPVPENSPIAAAYSISLPPKCIICVDSPIQSRFRVHDTHPLITAWAIRRSDLSTEERVYDYLNVTVGNNIDELRIAKKIIAEGFVSGSQHQTLTQILNYSASTTDFLATINGIARVRSSSGDVSLLTEFDGRNPLIDPQIPLARDPRLWRKCNTFAGAVSRRYFIV